MLDEFRRLALFTSGVAELTRHRAEQLVKDMVQSGEVRRDQASGLVKMVLELGKQNRQELGQLIRSEIRNQISAVGVVTERDFERLERRVARVEDRQKAAASGGSSPKTSRPKKRTSAKTSKKSTVRKKSTAKTASSRTSSASTSTVVSSTPTSGASPGPISDEGGPLRPSDAPRP